LIENRKEIPMLKRLVTALGLSLALATIAACGRAEAEAAKAAVPDRVARGKYLVTAVGCTDCHTPWKMGPKGPEPDMTRYLSGHPEKLRMPECKVHPGQWVGAPSMTEFHGAWGKTFAANLTPDVNTGLGIWTEDMFIRAIREGKHMGQSRPIMPPMPWSNFRNFNDEDLKSIYAYLRTIPPITNHVPDYEPPPAPDEK
jgi:mono/diheme cytochrome c family protein